MSEFKSSSESTTDRKNNDLSFNKTSNFKIGGMALLALPLSFGAFLFFGPDSVMWLPTPLRLVPFSVLLGCLLMAIYQKYRGAELKDTMRFILMTGFLAGLISVIAYYALLLTVAAGGVH
jgi:hypothetical protein